MSEEGMSAELARLRAEHRQVRDLLVLIQELTSRAVRSESVGDLFSRAFPTLFRCVPFDVGVAVMLEQNLDLYISTRAGSDSLVSDRLVADIRRTLEAVIPLSFATTEVVVKSESHDLPAPESGEEQSAARCESHALLEQGSRTAGLLLLFRVRPEFTED